MRKVNNVLSAGQFCSPNPSQPSKHGDRFISLKQQQHCNNKGIVGVETSGRRSGEPQHQKPNEQLNNTIGTLMALFSANEVGGEQQQLMLGM